MQPFTYLPISSSGHVDAQCLSRSEPTLSARRSKDVVALIRQNREQAQALRMHLESNDAGAHMEADKRRRFLSGCHDIAADVSLPSPLQPDLHTPSLTAGHEQAAERDSNTLQMMSEALAMEARCTMETRLAPLQMALKDLETACEALDPALRPVAATMAANFLDTVPAIQAGSKIEQLRLNSTLRYAAQLQQNLEKAAAAVQALTVLKHAFTGSNAARSVKVYANFFDAFFQAKRHIAMGQWDRFKKEHDGLKAFLMGSTRTL